MEKTKNNHLSKASPIELNELFPSIKITNPEYFLGNDEGYTPIRIRFQANIQPELVTIGKWWLAKEELRYIEACDQIVFLKWIAGFRDPASPRYKIAQIGMAIEGYEFMLYGKLKEHE